MTKRERRQRGAAGRLVFGAFLVGLGCLLLADNLGFAVPHGLWSYWPFLLIALGAVKMLWPGDADERGGGYWILVSGIYCWISSWGLYGLHWGSAWPIFLLAGGLGIFVRGLGRRPAVEGSSVDET